MAGIPPKRHASRQNRGNIPTPSTKSTPYPHTEALVSGRRCRWHNVYSVGAHQNVPTPGQVGFTHHGDRIPASWLEVYLCRKEEVIHVRCMYACIFGDRRELFLIRLLNRGVIPYRWSPWVWPVQFMVKGRLTVKYLIQILILQRKLVRTRVEK